MSIFVRSPGKDRVLHSAGEVDACVRARGRWILTVAILGSGMAFADGTVVNIILPTLQTRLAASVTAIQWVVEAYSLVLASLMLIGGALGDRFGRRRLFALGIAVFAAASMACGLAPDVATLIGARAVQGLGGALLVPGSLALISANFERERRGWAIGVWAGFSGVASGAGLVLGGVLIDYVSWRWVFFINVPVALLALILMARYVPESRDPDAARRLDVLGALLSVIALGGITFGLIEASRLGFANIAVIAALLVGVAGAVCFVLAERAQRRPMVPPALFREPVFAAANVFTLLFYAARGGLFFFLPLLLIQVHGFSATAAGVALLPVVALMFLLSGWSGRLLTRFGARPPLVIGPLLATVGLLLFARPGIDAGYWLGFFPAVSMFAAGLVISVAPLTTAVMTSALDAQAGLASGINNAISRAAGLLAIAALGPVLFFTFEHGVLARLHAAGVPAGAIAELEPRLDRLAAAAPPAGFDSQAAAAIRAAIQSAFVDAFRVVIGVCALLTLAAAIVAWLFIRPGAADTGPTHEN